MKFLLFCVLAGLSLAEDDKGIVCKDPIKPKGAVECLNDALYHTDGFFKNFTELACNYTYDMEVVAKGEDNICSEFVKILVCAGCPDSIFGAGKLIEVLSMDEKESCLVVARATDYIPNALGIGDAMRNAVCNVLRLGFAGECATKLLKRNLPDLLTKVTDLLCKGTDKLTGKQLFVILVDFGCFEQGLFKTDNPLVGKLLEENKEPLKGALDNVLEILKGHLKHLGLLGLGDVACPPLVGETPGLAEGGALGFLGGDTSG